MAGRKRKVNTEPKAPDVIREAEPDAIQAAIDRMAAAGEAVPSERQVDKPTTANATLRSVDGDDPDADFTARYEAANAAGLGYLHRKRMVGGPGSTMVPPNSQLHPTLKMWGYVHGGKWMIYRWVPKNGMLKQTRIAQGYTYFEGEAWCKRLGLLPEAYMREGGRIQWIDAQLMWHTPEYISEHFNEVQRRQDDLVTRVKDQYMSSGNRDMRPELLEGTDEEVLGELRDRRRFAQSRG